MKLDNPILNSPFEIPSQYWALDDAGKPTGEIVRGRRRSEYIVPIATSKRKSGGQEELVFIDVEGIASTRANVIINEVRKSVEAWRSAPAAPASVTYETARLLLHWRDQSRERPLFYCQVEAAETVIWLTEVAAKHSRYSRFIEFVEKQCEDANPGLVRMAMKLAPGAGKTTVMAMLIAWHSINKARRPNSKVFSDAFLIIAPGITIKDRLRVLMPEAPDSIYERLSIVPRDMVEDLRKARIVITNFHAFQRRTKVAIAKGTREVLRGREAEDEFAERFLETEGEMIQRAMAPLMGRRGIIVINDEAHHCYEERADADTLPVARSEEETAAEANAEAESNKKTARVWINGIRSAATIIGVKVIYDLSATPFFLRGSGYREGELFGWVISDFSLMDAIEAGIVKVPRVPTHDDVVAIIDDIRRRAAVGKGASEEQPDLFADFNGIDEEDRLDFYQHDQHWTNRMILGDSLQVMASLAEKEALRGKVQCIYMDPPYGIKFNSNWQVSTRDRDVKDGKREFQSREPEVVRAFRDTWVNGVHSYLDYLRDRLTVARDLLSESGSIFVQISDENAHRVRSVMDEVFGARNFVSVISTQTSGGSTGQYISNVNDYIVWYFKEQASAKFRPLYRTKNVGGEGADKYNRVCEPNLSTRPLKSAERSGQVAFQSGARIYRQDNLTSQSVGREKGEGAASWFPVKINGVEIRPNIRVRWKTNEQGMERLAKANRIEQTGESLSYVRFLDDFDAIEINNSWLDIGGIQSRSDPKVYVVQTPTKAIERCILMTADPGALVLDPTCGSGTTAYVAEQWGRRWITIDTSRVGLTLARSRIMGARYPFYALSDSGLGAVADGELLLQRKLTLDEASADRAKGPFTDDIANGFVYHRAPHVTLKSITNNSEIDVIWTTFQAVLEPLREELTKAAGVTWQEWQIPRPPVYPWPEKAAKLHGKIKDLLDERDDLVANWDRGTSDLDERDVAKHDRKISKALKELNAALSRNYNVDTLPEYAGDQLPAEAVPIHAAWWKMRLERQAKIDASIAANAVDEPLVDRPYEVKGIVRVAGPFTFDSLSPHRVLPANEDDPFFIAQIEEADEGEHRISGTRLSARAAEDTATESDDFIRVVLDNLKTAGVGKGERLRFTALRPFPGRYVNAEGRYMEGDTEGTPERKAAIFIGPEYGTVSRTMIIAAAREAADLFDVLVVCGFAFEAHASADTMTLGRLTVLKVNMNQDLRMGNRLKSVDQGNLFVVFGEPDVEFRVRKNGQYEVEILGVDIFDPNSGEQKSSSKVEEDIACWFIDDDYNESSFFVRQAYFLGGKDPYDKLKTALKAEIDEDAWSVLYSKVSRPFDKPSKGKIAVKVINHFGDEVMKVYDVRDARGA